MAAKINKTTESRLKAQKKYYGSSKDKFTIATVRLNNETDIDVIEKLASVENKQAYIKELIRRDIEAKKEGSQD